jgi:hypothetical protein
LKHLGDTLDLQATALSHIRTGSGLARIHAIKFYAMANALDSVVRVGQDLADEFVSRNDYIGARDVMERNVLPNVIGHKMVRYVVPARAQYAVILAYCGQHDAADDEMKRLAPYEDGVDETVRSDLQTQRKLIAYLRTHAPPPGLARSSSTVMARTFSDGTRYALVEPEGRWETVDEDRAPLPADFFD